MRKDFANRSARHSSAKKSSSKPKGGSRASRRSANKRPPRRFFHAPSFSGGMVLGAMLVLGGAYLPELLPYVTSKSPDPATTADPANTANPIAEQPAAKVQFEFDDRLRRSEVAADGSVYVDPQAQVDAALEPDEFLLQAASFRTAADANALRARLLLLSLPAATDTVALASGRWYRVTVGPFASRVDAQRAVTELRERDLSPLWIKRKADHT